MKESIRCCISCILPCGALDVVRIVHASGRVEEISRSVCAADIMQAYPKHVLRKPPSPAPDDDFAAAAAAAPPGRAAILPPNAELQRGKIYFLVPASPSEKGPPPAAAAARRRRRRPGDGGGEGGAGPAGDRTRLLASDRYLSEILSEKVISAPRERRRGRVGVWRPHLESISESNSNDL